jgi:ketosteroid isomerase-like protein
MLITQVRRRLAVRLLRLPIVSLSAVLVLASCSSGGSSAKDQALQKQADIYAISQIETKWHQASSTHDIDLMMSLWADDATFTVGSQTLTGKTQIRDFFLKEAAPFQAENHWVSDSPAYKEKISVTGNTGTLYFECDYIDVQAQKVVAVVSADQDVALIGGKWLITNSVAATPKLTAKTTSGY